MKKLQHNSAKNTWGTDYMSIGQTYQHLYLIPNCLV